MSEFRLHCNPCNACNACNFFFYMFTCNYMLYTQLYASCCFSYPFVGPSCPLTSLFYTANMLNTHDWFLPNHMDCERSFAANFCHFCTFAPYLPRNRKASKDCGELWQCCVCSTRGIRSRIVPSLSCPDNVWYCRCLLLLTIVVRTNVTGSVSIKCALLSKLEPYGAPEPEADEWMTKAETCRLY